jgi:hypothetical protein
MSPDPCWENRLPDGVPANEDSCSARTMRSLARRVRGCADEMDAAPPKRDIRMAAEVFEELSTDEIERLLG